MEIKVMMNRGIVESVLRSKDCPAGLDIEIVHVDPDYRDYEQLQDYSAELYADPNLAEVNFTTAHFDVEEENE